MDTLALILYLISTFKTFLGKNYEYFFNIYIFTFLFINLFIYLFLAVLGPRCCARAFSSCGERGLLFVAVRRLLTAVASLVPEHRH